MRPPHIDNYRFGEIVIDGQKHTKDVIILPDQILARWWRQEGHLLQSDDLNSVLAAKPKVLIVGQGAYGRMAVAPETEATLEAAGINLIAQPTEQACQTYNNMRKQAGVVAALHLTC